MKTLNAEDLKALRWLLEQRRRRESGHPETIHVVPFTLPTDNLWVANLETMASLQGETPEVLLHRYLVRGLEKDLNDVLATEGLRIGHVTRKHEQG